MIESSVKKFLFGGIAVVLSLVATGCGGNFVDNQGTNTGTQAQNSNITIVGSQPGVTPFISIVEFAGNSSLQQVSYVNFNISPQPNTVSAPVNVTWSMAALANRGYIGDTQGNTTINLPVFGLYAGYNNRVSFQVGFADGSVKTIEYQISTQPYVDSTGVFTSPTIIKARAPGSTLGFNFFVMKDQLTSPVIVDTDAQLRWVVPFPWSQAIFFGNGQFYSGSEAGPGIDAIQFDGSNAALPIDLPQPLLTKFTHNIDPGPYGLLAEFNGTDDLGPSLNDIVAEIATVPGQAPFQVFDMADILTQYMQENGDDPTAFVRPGSDWFHVNASTYDPSDNTVIISSRENFLIKVNYSTHDIVWIFGDPTKYWYTFPSLRAKALTLDAGGNYPIGQHGVTITSDGYVMVFNDGYQSLNQPVGEPPGLSRTYSEVSVYSVDSSNLTAHEVWGFDYGKTIYSRLCGSSYEAPGKTYLVDFSAADNYANARLIGLDSNHNVAFDFQYTSPKTCAAAWNAIPIPLENLQINQ